MEKTGVGESQIIRLILPGDAVRDLQVTFRGKILGPHSHGYDAARRVWNGMVDRHPALIVRCVGVADIINAVSFARRYRLPVAVRGGGYDPAGHGTCEGGLVIDLSAMKGIRVDATARVARAEPGLNWAEFDHETQAFGLATTGGPVSGIGIAGLTLSGGTGWLMRRHGLACDNLLSADIVTADGNRLTASETQNPDLFWAIRGGGGNFGIVSSFQFRLHPVREVLGGIVLYPAASAEAAAKVLGLYRRLTAEASECLTAAAICITAPQAPSIPRALHHTPVIGIAVCYTGDLEEGWRAVRPLQEAVRPAVDTIGPMPYAGLQTMLDAGAPAGLQNYWKAGHLRELGQAEIEAIVEHFRTMPVPLSQVHIQHLGGAVSRVAPSGTAYGHRQAGYLLTVAGAWAEAWQNDRGIAWANEFWQTMQPFSFGGYPGIPSAPVEPADEEGPEEARSVYGANYARLAELKRRYDPDNLFRLNLNIQPAQQG